MKYVYGLYTRETGLFYIGYGGYYAIQKAKVFYDENRSRDYQQFIKDCRMLGWRVKVYYFIESENIELLKNVKKELVKMFSGQLVLHPYRR